MSQHDFEITAADANTGLTMRAAINAALQALASNSSGGTEPGTKYPFMPWADSANDLLKIRNAGNTAWISVYRLSTGAAVATAAAATAITAALSTNPGATEPETTYPFMFWADTTHGLLKMRNAGNTAWTNIWTLSTGKVAAAAASDTSAECTGNAETATLATRSTYTKAVAGISRNFRASASGTSATIGISADELTICNSSLDAIVARFFNMSISISATGAGGLDTGMKAANTWYSIWVIYNPTTTAIAGLLSLSATEPTLPSGYTFYARVGWIRTDGTTDMYPLAFTQVGRKVQYKVASGSNVAGLPIMLSGVQGSTTVPTWSAASTSNFIPTTATSIRIVAHSGAHVIIAAPNNNYGALSSTTNKPPVALDGTSGVAGSSVVDLTLESSSVYMASNGADCYLYCMGWEDA